MTPTSLTIQLDALGGVAGDMFIAAVLHAFPHLQTGMLAAIAQAGVPEHIPVLIEPRADQALTGLGFRVVEKGASVVKAPGHSHSHKHEHEHEHEHEHHYFSDIRAHLLACDLMPAVTERAIAIFTLVAEAEAEVHGKDVASVSFHELGEWDSIADVVGAAFLIESLAAHWYVGPLPAGSGRVKTAHGLLPVPAPATALLLQGFECIDDGVAGERVTPTGAAILRYLKANRPRPARLGRLMQIGMGFGTRQLAGLSNVLRLLAYEHSGDTGRDTVSEITFEVDDQSPEDLAIAIEHLRALTGVRDVIQISGIGKKGRMTAQLQLLVDPAYREVVCASCFTQTTTIGLRLQDVERRILPRRQVSTTVEGSPVRVKLSRRGHGESAKAEADDIAALAVDHVGRDDCRQQAQKQATAEEDRSV